MNAEQRRDRSELARLKARYDSGAVPEPVFAVIRDLEPTIAWEEHNARVDDPS